MAVNYTIYRAAKVREHPGAVNDTEVTALIRLGTVEAGGAKAALTQWFGALPIDQQLALNGRTKFVVASSSNVHEFSPRVEGRPRLIF